MSPWMELGTYGRIGAPVVLGAGLGYCIALILDRLGETVQGIGLIAFLLAGLVYAMAGVRWSKRVQRQIAADMERLEETLKKGGGDGR